MRVIILSIAFLFLAFSAQSQVLKSAGVWYFLDVDSLNNRPAALPNGTELAYVVGTKKIYRWNRATSAWEEYSSGGLTMPFDSITFNLTTADPDTAELKYNADLETFVFGADGTTIEIGQKTAWYVKNQSGSTIPKGTVVRAAGTLGSSGRILIEPMEIDGTVDSKYLLGITASNIANGSDGYVIDFGKLRKFNTSAWNDGDVLYADGAGGLTNVEPNPPNLRLPIAFVVHDHATNGVLAVRVQTGNELHELHDVDTTGINTGNTIIWDGSKWVPSPIDVDSTNELQTLSFASPLLGISDGNNVNLSSLLTGYVTGSGTNNRIPKWSAATNLTDSEIQDNGTAVSILNSKPFILGQWTTAGRPTGVDGYKGRNTTTGFDEGYFTSQWENYITSTGASSGQVSFFTSAGKIAGGNNLFWNNSTFNLGLRTSSPNSSFPLTIEGTVASGGNLALFTYGGTNKYHINLQNSGSALSINETGVSDGRIFIYGNLIGINNLLPNLNLDIGGTLGIKIPNGTTAQRPASNYSGALRFNTSLSPVRLEYNDGSSWQSIARMLDVQLSGSGVDGQVTFWSGGSGTNIAGSSNFTWNNTLRQFGLNCNTPGSVLGINAVTNGNYIAFQRSGTEIFKMESQGATDIGFTESGVASGRFSLKKGGLTGINNNNPSYNLDVSGSLGIAMRRSNGDTVVIRGERVMLKSNSAFPYFGISDKLENNYMFIEKAPTWGQEKLTSNYRYGIKTYNRGVYSNVLMISQDTTTAVRQNDIIYGQKVTVFGNPGFNTRHVFLSNMNNRNVHAILIEGNTVRTNLFSITNASDSLFHVYANGTVKNAAYGTGNKEATDLSKTESVYDAVFATDGTVIERHDKVERYYTIISTSSPQTLSNDYSDNLINQGGTQATFTLTFPASPVDGQVLKITYNNAITTLTLDGNGNTIVGSAVTTGVAGSQRAFKFYSGIGWIKLY